MGVLFITHDMGVVAEIADRVLVMYRGDKVEAGSSDTVFAAPQHPYTKALLSAVPKLGAMQGTDLPAKFELLRTEANADTVPAEVPTQQDTVRQDTGPILRVRDLVTRFDVRSGIFGRVKRRVHAVEKISFDLYPGETLALVGESGCGKSTTGRSLLRLVESQSGAIEFGGKNIRELPTRELQALRRNIQFIFQDPFASLDPRVTVGFSIMEPLLIHNIAKGAEAQQRVDWLLQKVGLPPEVAQRYPHEFSGGQRQRIAIARALALNPKVVVADESVSALDVSIQAQIVNLLRDLQKQMSLTYLFIAHDLSVVEHISNRVAVMYLGRIVELAPSLDLYRDPRHPYTVSLLSAIPSRDVTRKKTRIVLKGDVPNPANPPGGCPFHPRCFMTQDVCAVEEPPLREIAPGHWSACHFAEEVPSKIPR